MPQDNKNPVVYRSQKTSVHVPSENSNYIDHYETRRRSKASSPTTEPIVEKRIILEDRREDSIWEHKMKTTLVTGISESQDSCSFELSQVSKEVEKLKEMMESWSKGKDSVGQSQSIARDLLKGALDLQESLIMLGKLQQASNFMAGLKKKSRHKFEGNAGKDTNVESIGSSRYGRYGKKMENPRLSVDGSKNSVQDLKNVIRESLSRQNLLVTEESSLREKDFNAQKLGLDRFRNYSYRQRSDKPRISVDGFSGSRGEELKNVIRDSLSKQSLISALSAPSDEGKPFSAQKQSSCLPDVCSSSSSISFSAPSDGGCKNSSDLNVLNEPKKAKSLNLIAKLMGLETPLPSETAETKKKECKTKKSSQWTPVINIEMPKVKRPQMVDNNGDPGRKALKEILDSMQLKGLLKSNHSGDLKFHTDFLGARTEKLNTEKPPIVIIKPLHSSGNGKDEIQTEELVKQDRASDSKPLLTEVAKKDREIKQNDENSSRAGRAPVSCSSRPLTKEANKIPKKAEKMPKGVADARNSSQQENTEHPQTLKSHGKTIPSKSKKLEVSPVHRKNLATPQRSTLEHHKLKRSTKPVQISTEQARKTKTKRPKVVKKSTAVELDIENKQSQVDDNNTNSHNPATNLFASSSTLPTDEANMETRQEDIEMPVKDHNECELKPLSQDLPEADLIEGYKSTEDSEQLLADRIPISNSSKDDLKFLLLSSPSFISCAEELFHFHHDQPLVYQTSKVDELGKINTRLLLDCADELMGRKVLQMVAASHPIKTHLQRQARLTFDNFVEELIDEMEYVRNYNKITDDSFRKENLHLMLERDLMCSNMAVNGVWDMGWLNGLYQEETEQIAGEVEKHVVEALVHEAVIDLVN
ncbi:uncharacterized protein [Aristolochia californica]|uniref:uncharacterized protein n=1 Tax=Aristolochia californica TaxID=171875 RepID=UPI0035D54285